MKIYLLALCAVLSCIPVVRALQQPSADALVAAAANAGPGPRRLPARVLPVPEDVSPELQALIRAPYPPEALTPAPQNEKEWANFGKRIDPALPKKLAALRNSFSVRVVATTIAGVKAWFVTPDALPAGNRNRLLIYLHGGGYVGGGGEAATSEAIMMAGIGGYRVVCVDYRLPPAAPYPAALDDVLTVWDALARTFRPQNMAIFGTSSGGGLALAAVLRARDEAMPLPGAVSAATPWSDLDKIGDSYFLNEFVDNMLVTWDGWLSAAARLYANGRDLKNPYLSPVYGDYQGFPPTILTAGARDLFLSNTIRVHRRMRRAGVVADLNVYEGMSHAQFASGQTPESREYFEDVARFFNSRLGR